MHVVTAAEVPVAAARPAGRRTIPSPGSLLARQAPPRRRSLRFHLLSDFTFLTSAAALLVGLTTVLIAGGDLYLATLPLLLLWLGSTAVFVLFGAHLLDRMVLRPLRRLSDEADHLAAGELDRPSPSYQTEELHHLDQRYRAMAAALLDAQNHVVRAEKLAGIGQLAAGVAHEVRNPLGALATYVEVLRRRELAPEVTGEMQTAIERIERTVQSLLDYARPDRLTGTTDPRAAAEAAVNFLSAQGKFRAIAFDVTCGDGLPRVNGDSHALEQVFVNLLLNASDVATGRIELSIQARAFEPDHWNARRHDPPDTPMPERSFLSRPRRPDIPAGTPGVLVCVADDGPGVPEASRERIFDPFYTTKDPGTGTGLGLAIVARTVHEAGGIVWVDRAREGGAAFKVFLPAIG